MTSSLVLSGADIVWEKGLLFLTAGKSDSWPQLVTFSENQEGRADSRR